MIPIIPGNNSNSNSNNGRRPNPRWDFFLAILRNLGVTSAFFLFGLGFYTLRGSRCNVQSPTVETVDTLAKELKNSEQTREPKTLRERVKNQSKNVSQTNAESVKKDEKKAIEEDTKENDTFLFFGKLIKQKKKFLNEIKKKRVARTGVTDEIALWHDVWELLYFLSSLPKSPNYGLFFALNGRISGPWAKDEFFYYYYPETYRYRRKNALSRSNFDPRRFWPAKDSFTQGTLRLKLECRPRITILVYSNQRSFRRRD